MGISRARAHRATSWSTLNAHHSAGAAPWFRRVDAGVLGIASSPHRPSLGARCPDGHRGFRLRFQPRCRERERVWPSLARPAGDPQSVSPQKSDPPPDSGPTVPLLGKAPLGAHGGPALGDLAEGPKGGGGKHGPEVRRLWRRPKLWPESAEFGCDATGPYFSEAGGSGFRCLPKYQLCEAEPGHTFGRPLRSAGFFVRPSSPTS